jgi:urease beta subunit
MYSNPIIGVRDADNVHLLNYRPQIVNEEVSFGRISLADDVDTTGRADGDSLVWNATTEKYEPVTIVNEAPDTTDTRITAAVAGGLSVTIDTIVEMLTTEMAGNRSFEDAANCVFESASSDYFSVSTLDSSKAIVCYRDDGNSSYGTACVLSISGTTITAGTPVVFESANSIYISVSTLDSSKAIVCYTDNGNSNYGTACVLSISGTTITAGTPVVFESATSIYISVSTLDSSKAIVCYYDGGNSFYGTACVLSISGTTITAGTPVVFESASSEYISVSTLDSSKAIVCYRDNGNSFYGTACVLSISGTTITAGTPVVFESASSYYFSVSTLDSSKAIVCYRDDGNSSFGTACVLSISGTTITAGTAVVFESASSTYISVSTLDSSKAIVCYRDDGNSSYGTACVLSISGTTITPSTPIVFEESVCNYISSALAGSLGVVCFKGAGGFGVARSLFDYTQGVSGVAMLKNMAERKVFESANSDYISVSTLDSSKAIVCYRDAGNSNYGTACVLSISGTTITAGTAVVFESANSDYISVSTLDSSKAIVCYRDAGNSSYGTACVLSISGTTITAGTPVVFESAASDYFSVSTLDSSKAIVCYRDDGNSGYGTACVLSISGTTITAGTAVVFESANSSYFSVSTLDSSKAIVCYRDNGNSSYGTACVLSISGTTITAGTPVVFESANSQFISVSTLDSSKAIVCYRDNGNSFYGTACVLSISGTTITAGTPVVFESASSIYFSVSTLDSSKAIVCYYDGGNSNYGTACVLSISGTTITAGTAVVFESANSDYISVSTLDSSKAIVCYTDGGNSNYGTASLLKITGTSVTNKVNPTKTGQILGYATTSGSSTVTVALGPIVKGRSGLVAGKTYYVSSSGIDTVGAIRIGVALSSTELYLRLPDLS